MTRTRDLAMAAALVLGSGALAQADLLDEVQKQVTPVLSERRAAEVAATREAEARQKKALAELERAQAKLKEAQARFDRLADESKRVEERTQATRKQAAQQKEAAATMTQAARELQLAAAAVARGDANVEPQLARARKDAKLERAARALSGMAAYLRGDDAQVQADLSDEIVAAFPSSRRYRGLARLRRKDEEGAWKDLSAAPLAARDLEAQLALGKLAEKRKDAATAQRAFGLAFTAEPTNGEAGLGLARALFAAGRPADARAPLEAITDPGDRELEYMLAVAHDRAAARAHAQVALSLALKVDGPRAVRDPSYARVHRPLRVVWVPGCWGALPIAFDEAQARTRLACWDLEAGDHEAARKLVTGAAVGAEGLFVRGLADRRAGRLAEARAALTQAVQAEPTRPEPKLALGVVLLEAGEAQAAREQLAQAGEAPAVKLALGLALAELGQKAEAERVLGALAKGPLADAAATNLAAMARAAGPSGGAQAARLLPVGPATPEGLLLAGLLALERKEPKAAVTPLRRAVALQPGFVDAWVALARALEASGDAAGAKDAAQKALEIAPDLVEARAILGRVLGREGDRAAQARELARIRELGEEVASAAGRRALAVLAFENHSGDAALDWLSLGVPEALVSDLGRLGGLTLVERTQVQKAFAELKLQELGFTDPAGAAKVGKLTAAEALLVGQIVKDAAGVRLDGRVIDAASGKVLKTASAAGPLEHLFDVERRLALELLSDYALATAREQKALLAADAPSLASLERVARVRLLSTAGKAKEARAVYERLLRDDPQAAARLAELRKSWADAAATVAVLPLGNLAGRGEDAWLGVGLAESLTTDLRKLGLFLVERQQLERLMQERRFTEIVNEQQAVELGKLAGAQMLVVGSYQVQGESLRIDARLVEAQTAQVLDAWTVEGRRDALFEAENRLVERLARALKVEPDQVERAQLSSGKPSLDDFKRYIQASSRLVVKPAAPKDVVVTSLAVAPIGEAGGPPDAAATAGLTRALARNTRARVRASDGAEPRAARADALVVGTLTRLGDRVRLDARALLASSGEVVASSSALGTRAELERSEELVARNLLAALGLQTAPDAAAAATKRPLYKRWWLWTTIALAVGGGVAAGVALGVQPQRVPSADATLTAR